MTTRRHYIISYDISDDKRRNKVFEALSGRGDHAQFSVFFCQLNPRELADLQDKLLALIHSDDDQILIVDLGPANYSLELEVEYLGKPFCVTSRVVVV